jgi:Ca-activated chloride channel homolog
VGFGNILLVEPQWLWLLIIVVVCGIFWRAILKNYKKVTLVSDFGSLGLVKHPLIRTLVNEGNDAFYNKKQLLLSDLLLFLIITCIVITLCQPVRLGEEVPNMFEKQDILFIVDTSLSMVLKDYTLKGQQIQRIDLLKSILKEFVEKLSGERISIIVFGETANTLVPLTRDQHLLNEMINKITAGMVGRYNAIGDAIAMAVRQVDNKQQRNHVFVLFSDAGQNTGKIDPIAAALLAQEKDLPIFTVTIGASTANDLDKNKKSGLLYQSVDTNLLENISKVTNGKNYSAVDSRSLEQALSGITQYQLDPDQLDKRFKEYTIYIYPLIAGLILLTIYQVKRF